MNEVLAAWRWRGVGRRWLGVAGAAMAALAWGQGRPGLITTVAGNGSYGFAGEWVAGWRAQVDAVYALVMDARGNLYIADSWNHRVRMLSPDGMIRPIAGTGKAGFSGDGGQAGLAQLWCPRGLALDAQGNLYIADSGNSRIRRVAPDGTIATVAGTSVSGSAGDGGRATAARLNSPRGLALDERGSLYIGDGLNYRIRKVTSQGMIYTVAGTGTFGYSGDGGPAVKAQLGVVQSMAFDSRGNLLLVDSHNHCVRKIFREAAGELGGIITVAGGGGFGAGGDGGAAEGAQLRYPRGLVIDPNDNLYVADAHNHRIRMITAQGSMTTVAGIGTAGYSGDLGPPTCAQLNYPYGLAMDPEGVLVVADLRNYRLRRVWRDPAGARPVVPPGGVINAAGAPGPVAPGSLVSIYGRSLSSATCTTPGLPLGVALGGASVSVGGKTAPLLHASPGQINAQFPAELAPGWVAVKVGSGGQASEQVYVEVTRAAPGVFTVSKDRGAIVNQDGTLNSPERPAPRGSAVTIYATGQGSVSPRVEDGMPAPAEPLAVTPDAPEVTIGGARAEVFFSGLAPGYVGLWQINARVPTGAPTGAAVPVRVSLAGVTSAAVGLAVR